MKKQFSLKKLKMFFSSLNPRERIFVVLALGGLSIYLIALPFLAVVEWKEENDRLVVLRTRDLENITHTTQKYRVLNQRLEKLQTKFDQSQMSFERVTSDLDAIVKKSIGSDNYNLKKTRAEQEHGAGFRKQDFSLRVNSLSLDQLVKLLHNLEHGESPLFLRKVNIAKARKGSAFRANLEIFSIRKASDA